MSQSASCPAPVRQAAADPSTPEGRVRSCDQQGAKQPVSACGMPFGSAGRSPPDNTGYERKLGKIDSMLQLVQGVVADTVVDQSLMVVPNHLTADTAPLMGRQAFDLAVGDIDGGGANASRRPVHQHWVPVLEKQNVVEMGIGVDNRHRMLDELVDDYVHPAG